MEESIEEVTPCPDTCANCHYKSTNWGVDCCCHEVYDCPCDDYEVKELR